MDGVKRQNPGAMTHPAWVKGNYDNCKFRLSSEPVNSRSPKPSPFRSYRQAGLAWTRRGSGLRLTSPLERHSWRHMTRHGRLGSPCPCLQMCLHILRQHLAFVRKHGRDNLTTGTFQPMATRRCKQGVSSLFFTGMTLCYNRDHQRQSSFYVSIWLSDQEHSGRIVEMLRLKHQSR